VKTTAICRCGVMVVRNRGPTIEHALQELPQKCGIRKLPLFAQISSSNHVTIMTHVRDGLVTRGCSVATDE
jgi:hypothetical protein